MPDVLHGLSAGRGSCASLPFNVRPIANLSFPAHPFCHVILLRICPPTTQSMGRVGGSAAKYDLAVVVLTAVRAIANVGVPQWANRR